MKPDNGGCAFPFEGGDNNGNQPDSGMFLRDYFAAKAMAAVWADIPEDAHRELALESLGRCAYEMADAMIKARQGSQMDKYQDLREAAEKATPGPWRPGKGYGAVVADTPTGGPAGSDHVEEYGGHLVGESIALANSSYIAAANPATIQALLAERDALASKVQELESEL